MVTRGLSPEAASLLLDLEAAPLQKQPADLEGLQRKYGLIRKNDQLYALAFVHTNGQPDLASYGVICRPGQINGSILRAMVPVSGIRAVAADPAVQYLELGKSARVRLDNTARRLSGIDAVHAGGGGLPSAYKGKDVVVGVIDIGIDFTHPTFFDQSGTQNYRIKKAWLQADTDGNPPANYDYGAEYTGQAELLAKEDDRPRAEYSPEEWAGGTFSHATVVSGIVAGSGGGKDQYRGVAPESELVIVSIDGGVETSVFTTRVFDAVEYIFDYAASVNKPCVINMSLGTHEGPHDGTSTLDKGFDQVTGPGRLLVGSAGNEGTDRLHVRKTFSPSDNKMYSGLDFFGSGIGQAFIDIWGDPGHSYQVAVHLYDRNADQILASTSLINFSAASNSQTNTFKLIDNDLVNPDTTGITINNEVFPGNQKPHAYIKFDNSNQDDSALVVLVEVRATSGGVHVWTERCSFTAYNKPAPFRGGDLEYSVGEVGGTGNSVISVGAYNSTLQWTSLGGMVTDKAAPDELLGDIAGFSSIGPTADGRTKPDIAAPGQDIISSSSLFGQSSPDYSVLADTMVLGGKVHVFQALQGTSFSSPMVAGALALALEANSSLTPDQARALLKSSATTDVYTGSIPTTGSNTWGWGKLSVLRSLQQLNGITSTSTARLGSALLVYPNPSQGTLHVVLGDGASSPYTQCRLVSTLGQTVYSQSIGTGTRQLELSGLPAGLYTLILDGGTEPVAQKVVVQP
jgi:hypothetical protein